MCVQAVTRSCCRSNEIPWLGVDGYVVQVGKQCQPVGIQGTGDASRIRPAGGTDERDQRDDLLGARGGGRDETFVSGGMFSFSFYTMAGLPYLVQASDSLDPSNWQTLEEIA
jgi:hypothetical protein